MGRIFLIVLFFSAAAAFGVTLVDALTTHAVTESEVVGVAAPVTTVVRASPPMMPAAFEIPAIGVSADVIQVGVGKSGRMATLESFSDVGWYKYGSAPGEQGSAVFSGHLDNALGMPGVFSRLHELERGDEIRIRNAAGRTLTFVVTKTEVLPYDTADTGEIFADGGEPSIVLITCEGEWSQELKQYSGRRAVFATLES